MTQQPGPVREGSFATPLLHILIRFFRHTGGHSHPKIPLFTHGNADKNGRATPFAIAYSRKPGFTETRLRPLARRRERTFWPPWVFMRVRNPCFLDRLRRLGWNVRLGMKNSCS